MQYLLAALSALAILTAQYFYGGIFRPALAFPSYFLVGIAGLLTVIFLALSRKEGPKGGPFWWALILFLWLGWRCLAAPQTPQASGFLQLILGCFSMYLLFVAGITKSSARMLFILLLLGGAFVQSVAAGGQFFGVFTGQPQGWWSEQLRLWYDRGDNPTIYGRAHGFYINGNHLPWFLNSVGFCALALGAFGRGRAVAKIGWIYMGGLCLAVSLACLSRGGLLAMGGGMVFLFLLSATAVTFGAQDRRLASFLMLFGAFVIPTVIILFIINQNTSIQLRMNAIFDDTYRPRVWLSALREFQLQPFFGEGPGAFAALARQFRSVFMLQDDYFAHNDWLQLAADFGYPALALAILGFASHLVSGWMGCLRILKGAVVTLIPQSNGAAILMGAGASLVAFGLHSFFDFNLQLPANALLASALAGILASPGIQRSSRSVTWVSKAGSYGSWAVLAVVPILLLLTLWTNRDEITRLQAENLLLKNEPALAWRTAVPATSPSSGEFHLKLIQGAALLQAGEATTDPAKRQAMLTQAVGLFRRARELAPEERSAVVPLSRTLLLLGNLPAAKKMALEVIRLEPRQIDGYELYGAILESEGDRWGAQRVYALGESLRPTDFSSSRLKILRATPHQWSPPSERK